MSCAHDSCKNDSDDVIYNELYFYDKVLINVSVKQQKLIVNVLR